MVFRLPDPDVELAGVRLWSEVPVGGDTFERTEHGWELSIAHPGAHRIEYLYTLDDGVGTAMVVDPTNPRLVDGVFGSHSWLPMPGYEQPSWLTAPRVEGRTSPVAFDTSDGALTGAGQPNGMLRG